MNHWALQVLHCVIEAGSLQAAAANLHRTPPALSMTIAKLEQSVGFALVERTGYRLKLTARGELFMHHAREILRQHERLESVVEQLKEGVEPQLRIGLDAGISGVVLHDVLIAIQHQYPATQVRVSSYSQLSSLREIAQGNEDLAIAPWLPTFQQMADFESLRIGRYELIAAISADLVARVGLPKTREALGALPYILPQQMNVGINPEQIYRMPGRSQIRVNDLRTSVELIQAGMGWGVAPRQMIAEELERGSIIEINVPGFLDHMSAEFHIIKLATRVLGPSGQLVWNHFVEREFIA
ncbi:LysR family transcriptional regulator [Aliidiomarina celeris]|uniref:LysR family transcriptional regulator n=1 Tax=Aliidiomarina celeris TaxID=2249428 RepID=UPI000DEA54F0|nr:LysR family transcriptional regulator [Aliidiomarina celeris]